MEKHILILHNMYVSWNTRHPSLVQHLLQYVHCILTAVIKECALYIPKNTMYIKKYFTAIVEIHLSLYVPFQLWKFQILFSIWVRDLSVNEGGSKSFLILI